MSDKALAGETAISDFLKKLINSGNLLNSIVGADNIQRTAKAIRNPELIPTISIDSFQRSHFILSADRALDALSQLELVCDNRSISRRVGERLLPDFVLFNRERGKIVILEVKNDALPEREAVTELLAYEREVLNQFPFLGKLNIVFVLIARDWNTLLCHSYANLATFGHRSVVGLTVSGTAPELKLAVRTDEAWMKLFRLHIRPESLKSRSYHVRLPNVTDTDTGEIALNEAAALMRGLAERTGQHGFCMTWKDVEDNVFGISVYTVDPAWLYRDSDHQGLPRREGSFSEFFDALLAGNGRIAHEDSLETLVGTLRGALGEPVEIIHLRDGDWASDVEWFEQRAIPSVFKYWGILGAFAADIGTRPVARRHFALQQGASVEDAPVGFHIVTAAVGDTPFVGGQMTAAPVFHLGALLGRRAAVMELPDPNEISWQWIGLRLLPYLAELSYLTNTWVGFASHLPTLRLFADPGPETAHDQSDVITWLKRDVLTSDHPLETVFTAGFQLGRGQTLETLDKVDLTSTCAMLLAVAEASMGTNHDAVWSEACRALPEPFDALRTAVADGRASMSHLNSLIALTDQVVSPLRRRQHFLPSTAFDFEDLRRGIDEMLRARRLLPCINIGADGGVGTAIIDPPPNLPQIDHAEEVWVVVRGGDADRLFAMEWSDLIDSGFQAIANYVSGCPIELEAWSADGSAPATGVIDTKWKHGRINLSDRFLNQPGTTGMRFFQLALSPSMPTEMSFLINTEPSLGQAIGSLKRPYFDASCGVVRVDGAIIAFIVVRLTDEENGVVIDEFLLAFDPFSEAACGGFDSLARQSHIHVIIADLHGKVLDFQEFANSFAFDQFANFLRDLAPGTNQAEAAVGKMIFLKSNTPASVRAMASDASQ